VLRLPIAHGEGNYFATPEILTELRRRDQVVLRYCHPDGQVDASANPNGSLDNIAGICNEGRNVFGLMPHPERASEPELGGVDGRVLFESMLRGVAIGAA
jgi:phosphoribosylformylglycinamidine synthase